MAEQSFESRSGALAFLPELLAAIETRQENWVGVGSVLSWTGCQQSQDSVAVEHGVHGEEKQKPSQKFEL